MTNTKASPSKSLKKLYGSRAWIALAFAGAAIVSSATAQSTPTPAAAPPSSNTAPPTPTDNIRFGYIIHQSVDFGGHIVSHAGSAAMYDTLVNIQSGPRILDSSLTMLWAGTTRPLLFDRLSTSSFGYGGDPNSASTLNFSKGKLYDFRGTFRRDRQYSNYDLLSNPLIPPASAPFVPVLDSPHLFNTVRRMTDLNLALEPLARFSLRLGYAHIISQGPSLSTIHEGAEGLLTQYWRNGTDTWTAGLDWKIDPHTTVSYDEFIMHYKGDTRWLLTGLNNTLSNGTPVALGVDLSSIWATPCAAPFSASGTVNPTCNAFLGYSRSAPTRTLSPTEQLRFQSASIPKFTLNGRVIYSATTSNLTNYNETYNGLTSRSLLRESIVTGSARVRRLNVNGDLSLTWQITPRLTATNVYNFWNFRMPGTNSFTETDFAGASLITPPGATTTTKTTDDQFLNQKTKTNTSLLIFDVTPRVRIDGGFRYRSKIITDAGGDFIPIHEDWALFGMALRPTNALRVNFNVEAMYADKSFTRISPRQMQHYIVRTTYKPKLWLLFNGTMNIRESRDNVQTVNHLEHNRDFSFGASVSRSERWSLDLNYSYDDIFSRTIECYASTPAPPNATAAPSVCVAAATPLASTGYYNAPTQFANLGLTLNPAKKVHMTGGYRISEVSGSIDAINIRQVTGPLQSQFHTPYANLTYDLAPNWSWRGDYNYYGYGEAGPSGPTSPRSFHGNICTLAVHYAF